ncbi:MAG: response regulator transcription factor [Solirubrobacterales bacterium]
MPQRRTPRVALGRFANLISLGLWSVLGHDPGVQVVATNLEYHELIAALANKSAPHIVVIDERVAVSAVISGLRARSPTVGIVVITHSSGLGSRLLRARLEGRNGISCLSTDSSATDLCAAVRLAADGQALLAADVARQSAGVANYALLTPREREVLSCLFRGRRPAQIASELHIAPSTTQTHVKRIYRKLGVNSRAQLLALPPLERDPTQDRI